jgi:hypothetical protein
VREHPARMRRGAAVVAVSILTLVASASAADADGRLVPSPSPDSPQSGLADVAALSATNAWAVGSYFDPLKGRYGADRTLVERWDGRRWTIVPTPEFGAGYSQLTGVAALSRKNVWVVGSFTPENTQRSLALHFNGRKWKKVRVPDTINWDDLGDVSAVAPDDVWAIGNSYLGAVVIHWDGRSWKSLPSPVGYLTAVHAVGKDDVWAVGQRAPGQGMGGDDVIYESLAAHWDGGAWTVVDTPNLPFHFNLLEDVSGASSNDLWAVGAAWDSTKPRQPLVIHWDGTSWSLVPSADLGGTDSQLFGVAAVRPDLVWAVGRADGAAAIERWNGSEWSVAPIPDAGTEEVLAAVVRTPAGGAWAVGSAMVGPSRKR